MAMHKKNVLDIGTKMEIIKEKDNLSAKQIKDIAEKLGKTDFHASNGWLESFRKRRRISFKAVCGVAGDASDETVNTWIKKIEKLFEGYEPQNIVNADESGIFVHGLPTKSLCIKKAKCTSG
ncbi:hypothetical protein AVEN_231911-1 [Araneus ventricosus]|uniref:HTH CENPB-type domain-containing protein n=1 Tax=Araneus ventricosus TaxID=182803 RepID=A0A4Y2S9D4_ARAVE|nr:hypothetical protein AVEN_62490-1 [Araneus ventricosus]GBN84521.1 hypothetical protein AVEN_231911-1 [Araneus ventricosus]